MRGRKIGFLKKGTKEHKVMWYYNSMEPEGAEPLRLPLLLVLQERPKHREIKRAGGDGMAAKSGAGDKDEMSQYVTKDTIAQLFEVTGRRIEQLVSDGVIDRVHIKGGGVRFELKPTIQKYIRYLSDKAYGRDRSEVEARLKEQKLRADVALKESQGELHRLRTEIAVGNYISIEEVKADYSRFFIVFKNFALSIPGKLAGRLTGFVDPVEVREIENDLQREIKALLKNFVSRAVLPKAVPAESDDAAVMQPKRRGRPRKNAKE